MRTIMTLIGLFLALASWGIQAEAQSGPTLPRDPDVAEYRLSMDKLRQLVQVQRSLNALAKSDPAVAQKMSSEVETSSSNEEPQLADRAAVIEKDPQMRAAFTKWGMAPRDYLAASGAAGYALMAFEIKEGRLNPSAAPPPTTDAEKANLVLLQQNKAEWQKIQRDLMQLWEEMSNL